MVLGGGVEPPRPEGRRILRAPLDVLLAIDSVQNHIPTKVFEYAIVLFRDGSSSPVEHT